MKILNGYLLGLGFLLSGCECEKYSSPVRISEGSGCVVFRVTPECSSGHPIFFTRCGNDVTTKSSRDEFNGKIYKYVDEHVPTVEVK